ncbi:MAG: hypothetical protein AB7I27_13375 [Bacteriovoracaceae bacterium]
MKSFIFTSLMVFNASASDCFVTKICLEKTAKCTYPGSQISYDASTGSLKKDWLITLTWKQHLECLNQKGQIVKTSQVNLDQVQGSSMNVIKELKFPQQIEDVPKSAIELLNKRTIDECEKEKQLINENYQICE